MLNPISSIHEETVVEANPAQNPPKKNPAQLSTGAMLEKSEDEGTSGGG